MNFHDPNTWKNYDTGDQVKHRIQKTLFLIPQDVKTILDAGCGNGLITNVLHQQYQVSALDVSAVALENVHCPKVVASVTEIPFPADSFDLVNCSEVLEHLTDDELIKALAELKRVAKQYILIGVPHREQLAKLYYRCAECGHIAHPYGHLQSFCDARLSGLLEPDYYLKRQAIFGPKEKDFQPVLLTIKQRLFKQWFTPYAGCQCSQCGSSWFLTQVNLFTKAINAVNRLLMPARPYWFIGLYAKKDSSK